MTNWDLYGHVLPAGQNGQREHIVQTRTIDITAYQTGTKVKYQGEEYIVLESTINVNGIGGIVHMVEIAQILPDGEIDDGSYHTVPFGHLGLIY